MSLQRATPLIGIPHRHPAPRPRFSDRPVVKGLEDSGFCDHMIANSNSDFCAGLTSGHHAEAIAPT